MQSIVPKNEDRMQGLPPLQSSRICHGCPLQLCNCGELMNQTRVEDCRHRQGGAECLANVTLGMQNEREHTVDEEHKEPGALVTARYCLRIAGTLMDQTCYGIFTLRYDELSFNSATAITPTSNLTHLTIQLLMGLGGGKKIFRTLRGILLKLIPSQLPTILLPQSTKTVPPSTSLPSGCMRT